MKSQTQKQWHAHPVCKHGKYPPPPRGIRDHKYVDQRLLDEIGDPLGHLCLLLTLSQIKGKVHPKRKLVWDEKADENKTHAVERLSIPRLVLEIFHFKVPHGRRHDSHFLKGNEAKMTSQLQYWNQVKFLFLYNSENHESSRFKLSGMILFLSSNQNK